MLKIPKISKFVQKFKKKLQKNMKITQIYENIGLTSIKNTFKSWSTTKSNRLSSKKFLEKFRQKIFKHFKIWSFTKKTHSLNSYFWAEDKNLSFFEYKICRMISLIWFQINFGSRFNFSRTNAFKDSFRVNFNFSK